MELTQQIIKEFVVPRNINSHKGQNGTVLIVGGSYIYHGAPILASQAALYAGSDLVYTAVPKMLVEPTRAISPNLIVLPMADQKLTRGTTNKLLGLIPKNLDSATIGMGLAIQETGALKNLIKTLLDSDVRLSLDASALIPDVLPLVQNKNVIVTPHAGEFKRLFGQSLPNYNKKSIGKYNDETVIAIQDLAKQHGITILLKGPTDIITDGKIIFTYTKKVPAMTVGGTGDVLSGLAAAMLAKNRNTVEAAACAAYINGTAGELAQKRFGFGMTATDLVAEIRSKEISDAFDKNML